MRSDSEFLNSAVSSLRARARQTRGFRTRFAAVPEQYNMNAHNPHILNAALAAGLYPKLLTLHANGLQTISNQQPISMVGVLGRSIADNFSSTPARSISKSRKPTLAPTTSCTSRSCSQRSCTRGRLAPCTTEPSRSSAVIVRTSRQVYSLNSSVCAHSEGSQIPAYTLNLDRSIRYQVHPRTAIAIKILRQRFNAVMTALMRGKKPDQTGARWFEFAIRFLS